MRDRNVRREFCLLSFAACLLVGSALRAQSSIFDEAFVPKTQTPREAAATRPTSAHRRPVPTTAAVNAIQPLLEELYAKELADQTAPGKLRLASKLVTAANAAQDEPVDRYAMLNRSLALAASGGDPQLMMKIAQQLAGEYEVNSFEVLAQTVAGALAAESPPEWEVQNLVGATMAAAEAAVMHGEASSCETLLGVARTGAQAHLSGTEVAAQLRAHEAQILARLDEVKKIETARVSLKRNPNNAVSATVLGTHLCFEKNDWASGLPLLAKCDNRALRAIAAQDLAQPANATSQLSLADAWWGYAPKLTTPRKEAALRRAAFWYARAEPSSSGLRREVARKRMQEAGVSAEEALAVPAATADARKVVYVCDATGTMLGLKFKLVPKAGISGNRRAPSRSKFQPHFLPWRLQRLGVGSAVQQ